MESKQPALPGLPVLNHGVLQVKDPRLRRRPPQAPQAPATVNSDTSSLPTSSLSTEHSVGLPQLPRLDLPPPGFQPVISPTANKVPPASPISSAVGKLPGVCVPLGSSTLSSTSPNAPNSPKLTRAQLTYGDFKRARASQINMSSSGSVPAPSMPPPTAFMSTYPPPSMAQPYPVEIYSKSCGWTGSNANAYSAVSYPYSYPPEHHVSNFSENYSSCNSQFLLNSSNVASTYGSVPIEIPSQIGENVNSANRSDYRSIISTIDRNKFNTLNIGDKKAKTSKINLSSDGRRQYDDKSDDSGYISKRGDDVKRNGERNDYRRSPGARETKRPRLSEREEKTRARRSPVSRDGRRHSDENKGSQHRCVTKERDHTKFSDRHSRQQHRKPDYSSSRQSPRRSDRDRHRRGLGARPASRYIRERAETDKRRSPSQRVRDSERKIPSISGGASSGELVKEVTQTVTHKESRDSVDSVGAVKIDVQSLNVTDAASELKTQNPVVAHGLDIGGFFVRALPKDENPPPTVTPPIKPEQSTKSESRDQCRSSRMSRSRNRRSRSRNRRSRSRNRRSRSRSRRSRSRGRGPRWSPRPRHSYSGRRSISADRRHRLRRSKSRSRDRPRRSRSNHKTADDKSPRSASQVTDTQTQLSAAKLTTSEKKPSDREALVEKWRRLNCKNDEELEKKLADINNMDADELLEQQANYWIRSAPATTYYTRDSNTVGLMRASPRLLQLCREFQSCLIEPGFKLRSSQLARLPPPLTRRRYVCHHRQEESCSSDSEEEEEVGSEESKIMEELERKMEHPFRLHKELWFNEKGEMNDGPLCKCSVKARRSGIRHGIYVGEIPGTCMTNLNQTPANVRSTIDNALDMAMHSQDHLSSVRSALYQKVDAIASEGEGENCLEQPDSSTNGIDASAAQGKSPEDESAANRGACCDLDTNNAGKLYHYRITISPPTNFLSKTPTLICHDGHEFIFSGFSLLSHYPLPKLPVCKVIRFNIEYRILYAEESYPENFTIRECNLFFDYLFGEVLELVDLDLFYTDKCPVFHFMPRFVRELQPEGHELLPMSVVLKYLLSSYKPLVPKELLSDIATTAPDVWQDFAEQVKGMIVTKPGMRPSSVRVDQLDKDVSTADDEIGEANLRAADSESVLDGNVSDAESFHTVYSGSESSEYISIESPDDDSVLKKEQSPSLEADKNKEPVAPSSASGDDIYPVIVHFGIRPTQLSYAGNPLYQKAWRAYVKHRHLIANLAKPTSEDKIKLSNKEVALQRMRAKGNMKRDITTTISSEGFYRTGLMCDVIQHAMLVPVLACHLRFHKSLDMLERSMGYTFKDRKLLQLALTHPSYRENFGTNPDHARNSLTNCGIRQPQYGDRRIHYVNTKKRGITTLMKIMSRFASKTEEDSKLYHNERLEFLGDAVIEFVTTIHLFHMFHDLEEGGLATYRAALVQNQHLCLLAKVLSLDAYLLYAHGSDLCHEFELNHALANCFEALMGALYLDGGIEVAGKVFGETVFGHNSKLLDVWTNYPPHVLQDQEPDGDRQWIEKIDFLQNLTKFEDSIGVTFTHIRLLARAFTDRTVGFTNLTLGSNQRLEFLGDSVLQLVASNHLYRHFPDHHEGHLSLLRSSLVNNNTQAVVCEDLGMTAYARYAPSKGELKTKDKADLLEAFLGALYVDKGSLEWVDRLCNVCFFPRLQKFILNQEWNDPKSKLQQCCLTLRTMNGGEPDIPSYKVVECKGPTNTRIYTVAVYFRGERLASASGQSVQQAEMNAALAAMENCANLFPQLDYQRRFIAKRCRRNESGRTNTDSLLLRPSRTPERYKRQRSRSDSRSPKRSKTKDESRRRQSRSKSSQPDSSQTSHGGKSQHYRSVSPKQGEFRIKSERKMRCSRSRSSNGSKTRNYSKSRRSRSKSCNLNGSKARGERRRRRSSSRSLFPDESKSRDGRKNRYSSSRRSSNPDRSKTRNENRTRRSRSTSCKLDEYRTNERKNRRGSVSGKSRSTSSSRNVSEKGSVCGKKRSRSKSQTPSIHDDDESDSGRFSIGKSSKSIVPNRMIELKSPTNNQKRHKISSFNQESCDDNSLSYQKDEDESAALDDRSAASIDESSEVVGSLLEELLRSFGDTTSAKLSKNLPSFDSSPLALSNSKILEISSLDFPVTLNVLNQSQEIVHIQPQPQTSCQATAAKQLLSSTSVEQNFLQQNHCSYNRSSDDILKFVEDNSCIFPEQYAIDNVESQINVLYSENNFLLNQFTYTRTCDESVAIEADDSSCSADDSRLTHYSESTIANQSASVIKSMAVKETETQWDEIEQGNPSINGSSGLQVNSNAMPYTDQALNLVDNRSTFSIDKTSISLPELHIKEPGTLITSNINEDASNFHYLRAKISARNENERSEVCSKDFTPFTQQPDGQQQIASENIRQEMDNNKPKTVTEATCKFSFQTLVSGSIISAASTDPSSIKALQVANSGSGNSESDFFFSCCNEVPIEKSIECESAAVASNNSLQRVFRDDKTEKQLCVTSEFFEDKSKPESRSEPVFNVEGVTSNSESFRSERDVLHAHDADKAMLDYERNNSAYASNEVNFDAPPFEEEVIITLEDETLVTKSMSIRQSVCHIQDSLLGSAGVKSTKDTNELNSDFLMDLQSGTLSDGLYALSEDNSGD